MICLKCSKLTSNKYVYRLRKVECMVWYSVLLARFGEEVTGRRVLVGAKSR